MSSKARTHQRVAIALAIGLSLLTSACASPPPPPAHAVEAGALPLEAHPRLDEIDCTANNCVHWYRLDIASKGSLRLSVETFEPAAQEQTSSLRCPDRREARRR